MSSIGPEMPPHLTKRKRTPEDEGADSPPAKQSRNTDETDLDDGDESDSDDFGPNASAAKSKEPEPAEKTPSGPIKPPSNTSEIPLDESDSDDDYGPSATRATAKPEASTSKPSIGPTLPPKQPIGPTLPPADHQANANDSSSKSDDDDDDDEDDDYGPALPSSTTSAQRTQEAAAAAAASTSGPAAPRRDDWMLAPPTQSGYQERDPTKLKNRKFASGKSSPAVGSGGGGISSIWTETPEQKRKRLEDAVLGRGDQTAGQEQHQTRRTREEEVRDRRISENIAAYRGKSMYEEHQKEKRSIAKDGKDGEEEDDPSKRAFDREKDMALGGKIGTAQRRELLNRAKDFGGRFQKGSFL